MSPRPKKKGLGQSPIVLYLFIYFSPKNHSAYDLGKASQGCCHARDSAIIVLGDFPLLLIEMAQNIYGIYIFFFEKADSKPGLLLKSKNKVQ